MKTGRKQTYRTECAVYAYLKTIGRPAESTEIAAAVHRVWKVACNALRSLHECGLIHISGWRPVTIGGGHPARLWAFGHRNDAPKPKPIDVVQCRLKSYYRRRKAVTEKYGAQVAKRIFRSSNQGGADKIVIDGRVIYERKRV